MNKKLFVLLPAVMLLLASCDGNSESTTTSSTTTTTTTTTTVKPGPKVEDYGSKDAPLSVSQYLENVSRLVEKEEGAFSEYEFHVRAYVRDVTEWNFSYNQFNNFYLVDQMGSKTSAKVQRAVNGSGVEAESTLCKGDMVTVSGYAEYYANIYSFFPDGSAPKVSNLVRGNSSFKIEVGTNVTINQEFKDSYTNGSEISFTVKADEGYKAIVYANGSVVRQNDNGTYTITIKEDTSVEVKAKLDIPASDLPSGTYKSTINKTNCGMTTLATTKPLTTELSVKDDEEGKTYKGVTYTFSNNCNQHSSYDEFVIGKNASLLISAPNGKITTIVLEVYKSNYSEVYAGAEKGETAISGKSVTPETTGYQDTLAFEYEINNKDAYIFVPNGASYALTLYKIMVNIVVE